MRTAIIAVALAAVSAPVAAQTDSRVTASPNTMRLDPASIRLETTGRVSVTVYSAEPFDACAIVTAGAVAPVGGSTRASERDEGMPCGGVYTVGEAQRLVLFNNGRPTRAFDLISPPAEGSSLPWIVAILSAAGAVLSAFQWWSGRRLTVLETDGGDSQRLAHLTDGLRNDIHDVERVLQMSSAPVGRPAAGAVERSTFTEAPARGPVPPPSQATPAADPMVEAILSAIKNWSRAAAQPQTQFERHVARLRSLGESGAAPDRDRVLKEGKDAALVAISLMKDYGLHDDEGVLAAFRRLASAAGLTLIEPLEGEKYDSAIHDLIGRDPTPTPQKRGRIAKVAHWGLQGRDVVIAKAGVRTYD